MTPWTIYVWHFLQMYSDMIVLNIFLGKVISEFVLTLSITIINLAVTKTHFIHGGEVR